MRKINLPSRSQQTTLVVCLFVACIRFMYYMILALYRSYLFIAECSFDRLVLETHLWCIFCVDFCDASQINYVTTMQDVCVQYGQSATIT